MEWWEESFWLHHTQSPKLFHCSPSLLTSSSSEVSGGRIILRSGLWPPLPLLTVSLVFVLYYFLVLFSPSLFLSLFLALFICFSFLRRTSSDNYMSKAFSSILSVFWVPVLICLSIPCYVFYSLELCFIQQHGFCLPKTDNLFLIWGLQHHVFVNSTPYVSTLKWPFLKVIIWAKWLLSKIWQCNFTSFRKCVEEWISGKGGSLTAFFGRP